MSIPHQTRALWGRFREWLDADIAYLVSGAGWAGTNQIVSSLITLASAYVFANFLTPTAYGTYKYILAVYALLAIPALGGMNTATLQALARHADGTLKAAMRERVRWGALGALAGIVLGAYYLLQGNETLGSSFIALGLALPFLESLNTPQAALAGKKRFGIAARQSILNTFLTAIAVVTAVLLTHSVFWIIIAFIAGNLASLAVTYAVTARLLENNTVSSESLSFGFHLSIAGILGIVAGNADILTLWQGGDAHVVAMYAFALATVRPLQTLSKSALNLAQPKFAAQTPKELLMTTPRRTRQAFFITVPLAVAAVAVIPFAFHILFPRYADAIPFAQALTAFVALYPTKLYGIALTVRQHSRSIYIVNTVNAIVSTALTVILVLLFGAWGAVAAAGLQQVSSFLVTRHYFYRITIAR